MLNAAALLAEELGETPPPVRALSTVTDGPFARANAVQTRSVLGLFGIQFWEQGGKEFAECPGCGERDSLLCDGGGLKCLHDRCCHVGPKGKPGFRANVDIVAAKLGIEPLEAAKQICDQFDLAKVRNTEPTQADSRISNPPGSESTAIVDDNWEKCLRYNSEGKLTKDVGNVALILKNAPGFAGGLYLDTMANVVRWLKSPTYKIGLTRPKKDARLKDPHAVYVQQVLAKLYQLSVSKDVVFSAMEAAAHENMIHPVQDFLDHLPPWDGVRRVGNWLHQYLGAADNEYNAAVGRWWLISAVARAYQPGCQVDHMLVLEGGQGAGKSQAVRALGSPWTLGTLPDIRDSARAADVISAYWIVEIAELDALKGASMTRIKDFVSQQVDAYRAAYARTTVPRPRSCVFIGTTNEKTYLNDPTGARRFWPVRVENAFSVEAISADRDQIWAEAKFLFEAGERWHPSKEHLAMIKVEQEERRVPLAWEGLIAKFVEGRDTVTTSDIFLDCLKMEPRSWSTKDAGFVGTILVLLGYEEDRSRVPRPGGKTYQPRGRWKLVGKDPDSAK